MENLRFIQLQKGSDEHYTLLENLMIPYNLELETQKPEQTIKEAL